MEDIIVKKKFWDKKQILWTILTIIAITLVSVVFIKKYMDKKAITDQKNAERVFFDHLQELSSEDSKYESTKDGPLFNHVNNLSVKGKIENKEPNKNEVDFFNHLKNLSN